MRAAPGGRRPWDQSQRLRRIIHDGQRQAHGDRGRHCHRPVRRGCGGRAERRGGEQDQDSDCDHDGGPAGRGGGLCVEVEDVFGAGRRCPGDDGRRSGVPGYHQHPERHVPADRQPRNADCQRVDVPGREQHRRHGDRWRWAVQRGTGRRERRYRQHQQADHHGRRYTEQFVLPGRWPGERRRYRQSEHRSCHQQPRHRAGRRDRERASRHDQHHQQRDPRQQLRLAGQRRRSLRGYRRRDRQQRHHGHRRLHDRRQRRPAWRRHRQRGRPVDRGEHDQRQHRAQQRGRHPPRQRLDLHQVEHDRQQLRTFDRREGAARGDGGATPADQRERSGDVGWGERRRRRRPVQWPVHDRRLDCRDQPGLPVEPVLRRPGGLLRSVAGAREPVGPAVRGVHAEQPFRCRHRPVQLRGHLRRCDR